MKINTKAKVQHKTQLVDSHSLGEVLLLIYLLINWMRFSDFQSSPIIKELISLNQMQKDGMGLSLCPGFTDKCLTLGAELRKCTPPTDKYEIALGKQRTPQGPVPPITLLHSSHSSPITPVTCFIGLDVECLSFCNSYCTAYFNGDNTGHFSHSKQLIQGYYPFSNLVNVYQQVQ